MCALNIIMQNFTHYGQSMKYVEIGDKNADTAVIWAHGWGTNHKEFMPAAEPLKNMAAHYFIDFPGFGHSPVPTETWAPKDYAVFMGAFIKSLPHKNIIWIGHSFGCRVGVNLTAQNPDIIKQMILIAAAGLKRKRPFHKKIEYFIKVYTYKGLKRLVPTGLVSENWLKSRFGSTDYKNAGNLRNILIKTVNEHLETIAPAIQCPVTLIYGSKDDQTPVSMGQKYEQLIPNANLVVLDGYDHYTILTMGRHQLAALIKPILNNQ